MPLLLPVLVLGAMVVVAGPPAGALVPTCDGQEATIVGTEGNDDLVGTDGPDVIVGLGGHDTIRGGEGDDVLCGDDGADQLFGGPDDDHLDPGAAGDRRPDQLRWSDARNGITLGLGDGSSGTSVGQGHDTFVLGPDTVVVGTPFPDRIHGSPLDDLIRSGGGADVVEARRRRRRSCPRVQPPGAPVTRRRRAGGRRRRPGHQLGRPGPDRPRPRRDLLNSYGAAAGGGARAGG